MKRNVPSILLLLTYLLRIMVPMTNAAYLMTLLSSAKNDPWVTVFVVSLIPELTAVVFIAKGLGSSAARRIGCYITWGLSGLHGAAILLAYTLLPAIRRITDSVYMGLVVLACAVTAALAFGSYRSNDGTAFPDGEGTSANESGDSSYGLGDQPSANP